jgi:hypothetical protein
MKSRPKNRGLSYYRRSDDKPEETTFPYASRGSGTSVPTMPCQLCRHRGGWQSSRFARRNSMLLRP